MFPVTKRLAGVIVVKLFALRSGGREDGVWKRVGLDAYRGFKGSSRTEERFDVAGVSGGPEVSSSTEGVAGCIPGNIGIDGRGVAMPGSPVAMVVVSIGSSSWSLLLLAIGAASTILL